MIRGDVKVLKQSVIGSACDIGRAVVIGPGARLEEKVSRSSVYYAPRGESAENLALMRRMDALSLQYPFYGSRQILKACTVRRETVIGMGAIVDASDIDRNARVGDQAVIGAAFTDRVQAAGARCSMDGRGR